MSINVLVLENQADFRQTLCEHIRAAGYRPKEALTLPEISPLISRLHFLAAVIDVRMKDDKDPHDWSGLVEARLIAGSKVPVIILSAYDSAEDVERAYTVSFRELAPRAFISKNSDWPGRLKEELAKIRAEQPRGWSIRLKDFWDGLVSPK
jgi:CheY-like chemotaxis protein